MSPSSSGSSASPVSFFVSSRVSLLVSSLVIFSGCCPCSLRGAAEATPEDRARDGAILVRAPGGACEIALEMVDRNGAVGVPSFHVEWEGKKVASGRLGIDFVDGGPLASGLRVGGVRRRDEDRTVSIFPGKSSSLRERYAEARVFLEEIAVPHRALDLVLRAYDDGVAFRYEFPLRGESREIQIGEEGTSFEFDPASESYVLPLKNFTTSYENTYSVGPLSVASRQPLLGLPLLLRTPTGVWCAVTEADLTDYAGLYLAAEADRPGSLAARLSPLPGSPEIKVRAKTPHVSPWRVLMLADSPGRLIESNLVLALNEPCAFEDTSWIRPGKTTFPWWNGFAVGGAGFEGGLNTRTMLHYIDFCAEAGIPYHSLDGLEVAWYGGPIVPYQGADITKSVPTIDLPIVLEHAREKGVRLRVWMHWEAARQRMETAFPVYEKWGLEGVMVDFLDRDDQEMVRFVHALVKKAAEHHLTVTLHGIHKPTGIRRTYPNLLTYEGVLNLEYDKWSEIGSRASHELIVPFTRMLAGPLDYHHGCFRGVRPKDFAPRNVAPVVMGTRARMLAMYVVYEDPLPMMADYPEAYRGQPGLPFVVGVPTVWDETRVLAGEVGRCLAIARRSGKAWYLGAMTDDEAREMELSLSFLGPGRFAVEHYADPADPSAPATALAETRFLADSSTVIRARLAGTGGCALRITPAAPADIDRLRPYPGD